MSGASVSPRAMSGWSTMARTVLPTCALLISAAIFCWSFIAFLKRACFTFAGNWPSIFAAREPSSCEYMNTPSRSNRVRAMKSRRYSNSSSVSPGKPTMKVVRIAMPGMPARMRVMRFSMCSLLVSRFMISSMRGWMCCNGMST